MNERISYEGIGGLYEVNPVQLDAAIADWGSLDIEALRDKINDYDPDMREYTEQYASKSALLVLAAYLWHCWDCGAVRWGPHCTDTAAKKVETQPVNAVDYVPSDAVQLLVYMIMEAQPRESSAWVDASEKRFRDGHRHGLAQALRALISLESKITDAETLDELCSEMITDAMIAKS
jgi:hypothetical protein